MAEFTSHRRFYLSKRIAAKIAGDCALSSLWQSKQEANPGGVVFPASFPHRAALVAVGYTATEDLVGADECELWDWVNLGPAQAQEVLAAAAAL